MTPEDVKRIQEEMNKEKENMENNLSTHQPLEDYEREYLAERAYFEEEGALEEALYKYIDDEMEKNVENLEKENL